MIDTAPIGTTSTIFSTGIAGIDADEGRVAAAEPRQLDAAATGLFEALVVSKTAVADSDGLRTALPPLHLIL